MNWQPDWLKNRKVLDNKKDEQNTATRTGGRTQPNSGRFWWAKADVKTPELLIDAKETQRKSYTITRQDWETLNTHATKVHRRPCLRIKFVGDSGICELVVLPADILEVT